MDKWSVVFVVIDLSKDHPDDRFRPTAEASCVSRDTMGLIPGLIDQNP